MRRRQGPVTSPDGRARGQSLVELALVLPIMLILAMGTVDVGRILFSYIALEEAVQEGATYAAQAPTPAATLHARVEARVRTSSNHGEVASATVLSPIVCVAAAGGTPGSITVTATVPLPLLTPVIREILGGSVQLAATVVSTNLNGSC